MAAGLSLSKDQLTVFQVAFDKAVAEVLGGTLPEAVIDTDGPLQGHQITLETATAIRDGGPWGQHFPEPVFEGEFDLTEQRLLKGKHLKMRLRTVDQVFDGIAFNVDTACWPNSDAHRVKVVYQLDINHFRGEDRLQLMVRELWSLP